jgi:predicted nucleic acid-binding protein
LILYFDTSALIKLVIAEKGSDLAWELWMSSNRTVSSILVYPEGRAALGMAHRSGRLDRGLYGRSLAAFERSYEELISIGIGEGLAKVAGDRASEFGLRGYDAVHLATALGLGEEEVTLVTWDRDLADAAAVSGLAVLGTMAGE